MSSVPNDKTKFVINPFTGNLDAVVKFNSDRIVTNKLNAAGNPRMIWDPVSNSFIPDGPDVVISNAGNVIVRGT